jgi:hypothetical protein
MFRALALCWGVGASTHNKVRKGIVRHLCDQVNGDGNTELFVSFMKDVHQRYLGWMQYWGDDCESLLTTLGLNMNVVPVVHSAVINTFRTVLGGDLLTRILLLMWRDSGVLSKTHFGTNVRTRILSSSQLDKFGAGPLLTWTPHHRIWLAGLEVCESNTTYLVLVNDNYYHSCESQKDMQI